MARPDRRFWGASLSLNATGFAHLVEHGGYQHLWRDRSEHLVPQEPWIAVGAYPKYGHLIGDRELREQLAPLQRAHAMTVPFLLVDGLNDTNVPHSESAQMCEALGAHGRREKLQLFDDDGHEIDKAREPCGAAQSHEWVAQ